MSEFEMEKTARELQKIGEQDSSSWVGLFPLLEQYPNVFFTLPDMLNKRLKVLSSVYLKNLDKVCVDPANCTIDLKNCRFYLVEANVSRCYTDEVWHPLREYEALYELDILKKENPKLCPINRLYTLDIANDFFDFSIPTNKIYKDRLSIDISNAKIVEDEKTGLFLISFEDCSLILNGTNIVIPLGHMSSKNDVIFG